MSFLNNQTLAAFVLTLGNGNVGRGVAGGQWVLETGRLHLNPSPTLSTGRWVGMVGRSLGNLLPLSVFIHSASEQPPPRTSFLICKMGIPSILQTIVRCRGGNVNSFVSCHGPAFLLCQHVLRDCQACRERGVWASPSPALTEPRSRWGDSH